MEGTSSARGLSCSVDHDPALTEEPDPIQQVAAQVQVPESKPSSPEQLIDLATALRWAGLENPTIALAEETVRARLADRMQARALLFPTLESGFNWRDHGGVFQNSTGAITNVHLQSLYYGFGANAIGGRNPQDPGIFLVVHLADAYYAPQAAQQKVVQSRFDAAATRHYTLLDVSVRYLALVEAQARLAAYRQSLQEAQEIARLTANEAKTGQGRDADAQRAQAQTLLLRADAERTQEELGVAAAELGRLLDLDPSVALRPADLVPPLLELIDPQLPLPQLLEMAWALHPEIVAPRRLEPFIRKFAYARNGFALAAAGCGRLQRRRNRRRQRHHEAALRQFRRAQRSQRRRRLVAAKSRHGQCRRAARGPHRIEPGPARTHAPV